MNDMTHQLTIKDQDNRSSRIVIRKLVTVAFGLAIIVASAPLSTPAQAIDTENPDWPCTQRKVNVLTSAQIWDGPSVDDERDWRKDKEVFKLLPALLSRRIPIEDVEQSVEKFAQSIPESDRDKRLTLLFAGVLERTNTVRNEVLSGIERFQRQQEERAKALEKQGKALAELKKKAAADTSLEGKLNEALKRYDWDVRIFKERQDNIPIACEVPILIEQRAFALGRAIRNHMSN